MVLFSQWTTICIQQVLSFNLNFEINHTESSSLSWENTGQLHRFLLHPSDLTTYNQRSIGAWNIRYNPSLRISYISMEIEHPVTWILFPCSACFQCLFSCTYCMFQDTLVRLQYLLQCPKSHWALMSYTNVLRTTLYFVSLISKHFSYQNKGNTAEFYDQALENYDSTSVSTQLPRSLLQHWNSCTLSLDNLKNLTVQHLSKVVLRP
jgi:hypothetical protein